jgi:hypothetical protein
LAIDRFRQWKPAGTQHWFQLAEFIGRAASVEKAADADENWPGGIRKRANTIAYCKATLTTNPLNSALFTEVGALDGGRFQADPI